MGIYDTHTMSAVIRRISRRPQFFLNTFFPREIQHATQEVYFDLVTDAPRVSPFVHPLHEGKVVESRGYKTNNVRPAYIKDKRVHTPQKALSRIAGEAIGGELSPQQRAEANLAADLRDQVEMLERRLEVMAAEAIIDAKQTITGTGFGDYVVDFSRDSALDVTLAGAGKWDDANNKDRGSQLRVWDRKLREVTGVKTDAVIMDFKAYELLAQDEKFEKHLVSPNPAIQPTLDPFPSTAVDEVEYMGRYANYPIYVYSHVYEDPEDGTSKQVMPEGTVVLASRNNAGHRHFGAIQDLDSLKAEMFFAKSWTIPDPSVRYLLMQSAPLLVPHRVASMKVKVA